MAMNGIPFQAGLSLPSFLKQYGTEAQCEAALESVRWHQGFCCPACGEAGHYVLKGRKHKTFQCKDCRGQTSLIAWTLLFHSTHLALPRWFLAIYLVSQAKTGLSALALMRRFRLIPKGIRCTSKWLLFQVLLGKPLLQAVAIRRK